MKISKLLVLSGLRILGSGLVHTVQAGKKQSTDSVQGLTSEIPIAIA